MFLSSFLCSWKCCKNTGSLKSWCSSVPAVMMALKQSMAKKRFKNAKIEKIIKPFVMNVTKVLEQ